MKKLMIAAAIVCAAACAQAWTYQSTITFKTDGVRIPAPQGGLYSGEMTITCEAMAGFSPLTVTASNGEFYYTTPNSYWWNEGQVYTFTLTAETTTHTYLTTGTSSGNEMSGFYPCWFNNVGTWTEKPEPEPTPEPTSGLLMLLGMAGLALKRKQRK